MIEKNIFLFDDYKGYIKHKELVSKAIYRGFRSRLAEKAGCNNAFISQILNTGANFSLEQGLRVSRFLNHGSSEEQYFLTLIEKGRAGSVELREFFRLQLDQLKEKHLNLGTRVKRDTVLSPESQATYYSQWYYSAIHMLITIPGYRTIGEISKALGIKTPLVEGVISFLMSVGLAAEKEGELVPGSAYLHLDKASANISKHHTNWRIAAINSLQTIRKDDIHYSTVSSLSEKDLAFLSSKMADFIQEYVAKLSNTEEETLVSFNLDFFRLIDK